MPAAMLKKLVVSKGKSQPINQDKEVWIKTMFTIEMEFSPDSTSEDLQQAKINTEKIIDQWLSEHPLPMATEVINMEIIEAIPWKASKWVRKEDEDRKARHGEDAYVHRSECDFRLEQLIEEAHGKKVVLPPYEFTFSGADKQFVSRRAIRERKK